MLLAWMTTHELAALSGPGADPASAAAAAASRASDLAAARPYIRAVIAAVLRESPRSPDVEDCIQETLRRAIENASTLASAAAHRAWVTGIARHVALDHIRARQRSRARSVPPQGDDTPDPLAAVPDPQPNAERALATKVQMVALEAALSALPEGQREALSLFFLEDKSYQEISVRLRVPIGTVATWVSRGRSRVIAEVQEQS